MLKYRGCVLAQSRNTMDVSMIPQQHTEQFMLENLHTTWVGTNISLPKPNGIEKESMTYQFSQSRTNRARTQKKVFSGLGVPAYKGCRLDLFVDFRQEGVDFFLSNTELCCLRHGKDHVQ